MERLADLDLDAGDLARARAGYAACVAIWQHLIAVHGEKPDYLRGNIIPLIRLAIIDHKGANSDRARQGYMEALTILEQLMEDYGESPELLQLSTLVREWLADLNGNEGEEQNA